MKFSVRIKIRKDFVRKDGTSALFLQCFIDKKITRIPLNISLPEKYWNESKCEIREGYKEANDLNLLIRDYLSRANKIAVEYRLRNEPLTPELFKNEFYDPDARRSFLRFFELQIKKRMTTHTDSSISQNRVTLRKLRAFRNEIHFSDINYELIMDFERHLKKNKLSDNSISNHLKTVKTYINIAINNGISFKNPFNKIKVRRIKGNREYLSESELKKLQLYYDSHEISPPLKNVLQYFLFSCFTSIRISDVVKLSVKNIVNGEIVFLPVKTRKKNKIQKVPLHNIAKRYIQKNPDGSIFNHVISEQKTNKFLKLIAKKCGIKKRLTFHVARHTFATIFIRLGGNVVILKDILGHSNISETMVYVHIVDEENQKREEINVFDKLLYLDEE